MNLSKSEEELMRHIWQMKEAFMKDLLEAYSEPKPKPSTVATLLKRLRDKKAIDYKVYGSVRAYYPKISKEAYFAKRIRNMIRKFFNDSPAQFASFFTEQTELSEEELSALRDLIDQQIQSRQQ
ncbi:MAG: BlaI/MecI/CopY family transcriptional regulator [Bacteroidota bacterium]